MTEIFVLFMKFYAAAFTCVGECMCECVCVCTVWSAGFAMRLVQLVTMINLALIVRGKN